jgi:hypothetical protein
MQIQPPVLCGEQPASEGRARQWHLQPQLLCHTYVSPFTQVMLTYVKGAGVGG